MRARAFLQAAAGVFLLALAYHLGARAVGAQDSPLETRLPVSISSHIANDGRTQVWVLMSDGDAYRMDCQKPFGCSEFNLNGNVYAERRVKEAK